MCVTACAVQESFVRGGPSLTTFIVCFVILVDEGREDNNFAISGTFSACQQNAIICWRANNGPSLNAGLVA